MTKLFVIADDYTGAMDTAVQFASRAISVRVAIYGNGERAPQSDCGVLVVNTESRHLSAGQAYELSYSAAMSAKRAGIPYVYKKTDSTLRGNVGSELMAVMDAYESSTCLFVPAFPKLNRITNRGVQLVDGRPLAESAAGRDPFTPVLLSRVEDIIKAQCGYRVVSAKPGRLPIPDAKEKTIIVPDACSQSDMRSIARYIRENGVSVMAGSAGLAELLPETLGLGPRAESAPQIARCKKALVVCGSVNSASLEQVRAVERQGARSVLLSGRQKTVAGYAGTVEGACFIKDMEAILNERGLLIIKLADANRENFEASSGSYKDIAVNTGEIVAKLIYGARPELLIVFGGDTLFGIMSSLEGSSITPRREILSGVAESGLAYGGGDMTIVTKAGGFGEPNALIKILQYYGVNLYEIA